ncbi:hypothetical protein GCM10023081_08520 [Arthrobacter ginkgonis]|uniref:SGNH hydrolase-type esterase domain-containing protein n=1 Tax=Arthrobacter ginkgonis TaxID=1630594 RepID=A0ABP7BZ59_9MICC
MAGTVVVCGDSLATRFGLFHRRDSSAFPQLLRKALAVQGLKVVSLAKAGLMVRDTQAQLDRVINMDPAVVILFNGGRESLLRDSRLLNLIRTDPRRVAATGWKAPLQAIRRCIYKGFLASVQGPRGDLAATLIMSSPNLHHGEFRASFNDVLDAILDRTSAHVIAIVPCGLEMRIYPWSIRNNVAIQETVARSAQHSDRVTCIDLRDDHYLSPENFQGDGVHYSEAGHRAIAAELEQRVTSLDLAAATPDEPVSQSLSRK